MPAPRRPPPLTPVFVTLSGSFLARDDSQPVVLISPKLFSVCRIGEPHSHQVVPNDTKLKSYVEIAAISSTR